MAVSTYSTDRFIGINQSGDENSLSPAFSYDAANIDTSGGKLSVAGGYIRYSSEPVPGAARIDKLAFFRTGTQTVPIVITNQKVYAYKSDQWTPVYSYPPIAGTKKYDTLMARMGEKDYLIIADGAHQLIKYDGNRVTPFGSEQDCSDMPVSYLALYRGRLFSAGEEVNPNRLYYSCLPGGNRSIENWGYIEASPAVEGGHTEIGSVGGDPVIGIRALSNQLLIFTKNSLYRLIGDRPSNFTIERIGADIRCAENEAIAEYSDNLYFVTGNGLYYYNGVAARPCPDMKYIKEIMKNANTVNAKAAIAGGKLYFTLKRIQQNETVMIEYDLAERKYMLRTGFNVSDIAAFNENLYLINNARYVYRFGYGGSYDGTPINAYWCTPLTDFHDKAAVKTFYELYLRGSGKFCLETQADGVKTYYTAQFPGTTREVLELPLKTEGRCIRLKFYNEEGGAFTFEGGAQISFGIRKRTV